MPTFHYEAITEHVRVNDDTFAINRFADFESTVDAKIAALAAAGRTELKDEDCPYFGELWHSAKWLAAILGRETLAGKTVLELGCGLALPSIVAASKGAVCTCVDLHPDVGQFLQQNLHQNHVPPGSINYICGRWPTTSPALRYDRVVASDVLYEPQHVTELVASIMANLEPANGLATIVDPCRWYHLQLIDQLKSHKFAVSSTYENYCESGLNVRLCVINARISNAFT